MCFHILMFPVHFSSLSHYSTTLHKWKWIFSIYFPTFVNGITTNAIVEPKLTHNQWGAINEYWDKCKLKYSINLVILFLIVLKNSNEIIIIKCWDRICQMRFVDYGLSKWSATIYYNYLDQITIALTYFCSKLLKFCLNLSSNEWSIVSDHQQWMLRYMQIPNIPSYFVINIETREFILNYRFH